MSSEQLVHELCLKAKQAARALGTVSTDRKNQALLAMAQALQDQAEALKKANAVDVAAGKKAGLSAAMIDRLTLSDSVIASMAQGLKEVAALPDPVGEVTVHVASAQRPFGGAPAHTLGVSSALSTNPGPTSPWTRPPFA